MEQDRALIEVSLYTLILRQYTATETPKVGFYKTIDLQRVQILARRMRHI